MYCRSRVVLDVLTHDCTVERTTNWIGRVGCTVWSWMYRVVLDVLTHDCTVERTNLTIGRVGFTVWSWMYPVVLDVSCGAGCTYSPIFHEKQNSSFFLAFAIRVNHIRSFSGFFVPSLPEQCWCRSSVDYYSKCWSLGTFIVHILILYSLWLGFAGSEDKKHTQTTWITWNLNQ